MSITTNFATLTPAYGRDYRTAAAAIADFRSDRDFILHTANGSEYVSQLDFAIGVTVILRFDGFRKVTSYRVK